MHQEMRRDRGDLPAHVICTTNCIFARVLRCGIDMTFVIMIRFNVPKVAYCLWTN